MYPRTFVAAFLVGFMAWTSAESATHRVCASGCSFSDVQKAVDAASAGDTILLRAGETFVGHLILRRKAGDASIIIRSDAPDSELPGPGVRLVPFGRTGGNTNVSRLARLRGRGATWRTTPVVRTEPGAHGYILRFLEIDGTMQEGYETLVALGDNVTQTSTSLAPYKIVFDRVYVHGHPARGQKRCLALNSAATEILNSYFSDCKHFAQEAQAIAGFNGPGPFRIVNNYLEGTGENIMFGGADPKTANLVPSDILIARNHIVKPIAWKNAVLSQPSGLRATASGAGILAAGTHFFRVVALLDSGGGIARSAASAEVTATLGSPGRAITVTWNAVPRASFYRVFRGTRSGGQARYMEVRSPSTSISYTGSGERSGTPAGAPTSWAVKNLLELKNAQRVTIEGNVIENVWRAGQQGYALALAPRNQGNTAPWSVVQDVTIRYNIVRHVNGGINLLGFDYSSSTGSQRARRIQVANNLFHDVGGPAWGGGAHFLLITQSPSDVRVEHNTVLQAENVVLVDNGACSGFVFRNNLALHNRNGVFGSGAGIGTAALAAYFPGALFARNVLAGGPASAYPPNNWFPPVAEFLNQFAAPASGNFRLVAGSPYINAGTDGKSLGADLDALARAQSGTAVGAPTATATATPTPTPAPASSPTPTPTPTPTPAPSPSPTPTPKPVPSPPTAAAAEIVLTAADVTVVRGNWKKAASSASPGGRALVSTDRGRSAVTAPRPSPASYFEAAFRPAANVPYRVWLRLRGRSIRSDSVWVQFTGAVTESGQPLWRTGSRRGLAVVQSPCAGCQPSGWGWEDNGASVQAASVVRFASSAPQVVRIQMREDGVAVDHIVLSPFRYLGSAPGPRTNDRTILTRTNAPLTPGDVVLGVSDMTRRTGRWSVVKDETAAGHRAVANTNHGWSAVRAPVRTPRDAVEFTFAAVAGIRYRVWVRFRADRNSRSNDSVWLQFSGAIDRRRSAIHAIGTTHGVPVTLQECPSCGLSGWGWSDGSWWTERPAPIVFRVTGTKRLRIQPREDGARIDQVVLSPERYARTAPGLSHDDMTVLEADGTQTRP